MAGRGNLALRAKVIFCEICKAVRGWQGLLRGVCKHQPQQWAQKTLRLCLWVKIGNTHVWLCYMCDASL